MITDCRAVTPSFDKLRNRGGRGKNNFKRLPWYDSPTTVVRQPYRQ